MASIKPGSSYSFTFIHFSVTAVAKNNWLILDLVDIYTRGFTKFGIVKATYSEVFEDLKFKISEGSDQKLRQLTGQIKEITNFGPSLLKF